MKKFLNYCTEIIAKHFHEDASKMLIWTGVTGWILSAGAQILAIYCNKKISKEQKSFLIPQEIGDAVVNIGSFFFFTLAAKKLTQKLFTTGKIIPQSVKTYLEKSNNLYKDRIGKIDFNLGNVLKEGTVTKDTYSTYSNLGSAAATVGAGIVASNIITPVVRNKMASNVQKSYIDYKNNAYPLNTSNGMKI